MKVNEKNTDQTESNGKTLKKNGSIKRKPKKTENFQVKVPRIIVRNLNFKVDESLLKKKFEETTKSTVKTVSLVSKEGKSKGFGFLTFEELDQAQKAIEAMNGKKILGRAIAVDWSLPKDVYQQMQSDAPKVEAPKSEGYGISLKIEKPIDEMEVEKENEEKVDEDEYEDEDEDEDDEEDEEDEKKTKNYGNAISRDVREQRTLFFRNIPFDAKDEDLKKLLTSKKEYKIRSCLLVIDPVSRHPRGTAFVQFLTREDAEDCLNQTWTMKGQDLQADFALSRQDLTKAREIREEKYENKRKRDQRNLSLANYGVILNLKELDGNENELRKRQQLEDAKRAKLKNPMFFVSDTRLTIHNLPTNIDDKSLRNVVLRTLKKNHVPLKEIQIVECRVMRKDKDAKKSLRFGFLTLSRHEDARRVIDILNNNKEVFGPQRPPIVQFAVENHRALQLKEERRERLQAKKELLKNPTSDAVQFDATKTKKSKTNRLLNSTKTNVRLSQLIAENQDEATEEKSFDESTEKKKVDYSTTSILKEKRRKNKSKKEIRDKLDEFIAKTRLKAPMPEKKKKWFE